RRGDVDGAEPLRLPGGPRLRGLGHGPARRRRRWPGAAVGCGLRCRPRDDRPGRHRLDRGWPRRPAPRPRLHRGRLPPAPWRRRDFVAPAARPSSPGGERMSAPTPALTLRNVTRKYGALVAVDGVSLAVAMGGTHALSGPDGAGKSALLNLGAGTLRATSGEVVFAGEDVTRRSSAWRARRGLGKTF